MFACTWVSYSSAFSIPDSAYAFASASTVASFSWTVSPNFFTPLVKNLLKLTSVEKLAT